MKEHLLILFLLWRSTCWYEVWSRGVKSYVGNRKPVLSPLVKCWEARSTLTENENIGYSAVVQTLRKLLYTRYVVKTDNFLSVLPPFRQYLLLFLGVCNCRGFCNRVSVFSAGIRSKVFGISEFLVFHLFPRFIWYRFHQTAEVS